MHTQHNLLCDKEREEENFQDLLCSSFHMKDLGGMNLFSVIRSNPLFPRPSCESAQVYT